MVVMGGLASDVSVLPARQIQAFDGPEVEQELERAEDRRAADGDAAAPGVGRQVGGGEVAVAVGDELGDRPARRRDPMTCAVQGGEEGGGISHDPAMILSLTPLVERCLSGAADHQPGMAIP